MANDYITSDELKATLQITGTSMDVDIALAIDAASRAVDKACSRRGLRRFWADADYVARVYTAGDPDVLEIHDAYDIQKVESDEDGDGVYERLWDATEWVPSPLNAALDGEPYTALQWRNTVQVTSRCGFPADMLAAVKVTAKYGWSAVPPFVAQATRLIASRLAKRSREAPFAVVGFGVDTAAVAHIAKNDPDVAALIQPFIRDASARSVRFG